MRKKKKKAPRKPLTLYVLPLIARSIDIVVVEEVESLPRVLAELEREGYRIAIPAGGEETITEEWLRALKKLRYQSILADEIPKYLEDEVCS